jgi:hypothetical protein
LNYIWFFPDIIAIIVIIRVKEYFSDIIVKKIGKEGKRWYSAGKDRSRIINLYG